MENVERKVVVDVTQEENVIALLEEGSLVELQREQRNNPCAVGDIFLAKVKRIDRGNNALFLDLGTDKDAFLSCDELAQQDLLEKLYSNLNLVQNRHGGKKSETSGVSINSYLDMKKGQELLVQIKKEKINTKGATVTTALSLVGRTMMLIPFGSGIAISEKIDNKGERNRLYLLFESLDTKGFQFKIVVRTFAQGKGSRILQAELNFLIEEWQSVLNTLQKTKKPQRLRKESDRVIGMLRDSVNDSYKSITINNSSLYKEVYDYVNSDRFDNDWGIEVEMYEKRTSIFDDFDITRQKKSLFGRTVNCKEGNGAYLVIDTTEAMHVIDVNSGRGSGSYSTQEDRAFAVNMCAAKEIARQMVLRDLGGIIVIDFIDLNEPGKREDLYKEMCRLMATDKASHEILPLSNFSVMEITRQRVRPAVSVVTEEKCPCCNGSGTITASVLLTDTIEQDLKIVADKVKGDKSTKKIILYTHPFIVAYLKKGIFFNSILNRWRRKYFRSLEIVEDQNLELLNYYICDQNLNALLPFRRK